MTSLLLLLLPCAARDKCMEIANRSALSRVPTARVTVSLVRSVGRQEGRQLGRSAGGRGGIVNE